MAAVWRSQCAFAWIFGGKSRQILNNAADFGKILTLETQSVAERSRNYSNYANSPFVDKIKEQYDFEIVKKPAEWEYVQRLLPFETIPDVKSKSSYPSGWVPPKEEAKDLPFFFPRTRNHQLPIYLHLVNRGQTKRSRIKNIEGDIWLLNDEVKSYLKKKNNKYVETRVHELGRFIEVKGDHLNDLIEWAHLKGF